MTEASRMVRVMETGCLVNALPLVVVTTSRRGVFGFRSSVELDSKRRWLAELEVMQTPWRDDLRITRAHWNGAFRVVFEDEDHCAAMNHQLTPGVIGNTVRSQQTLGYRLVVEHVCRSDVDKTGRKFRFLRQTIGSHIALAMLERRKRSCSSQRADPVSGGDRSVARSLGGPDRRQGIEP